MSNIDTVDSQPLSGDKKIGIICASWHGELIDVAYEACAAGLENGGIHRAQIERILVPGSLEIPLMALELALTGRYAALIGIGLVVNGGIYRHEFVAQAVLDGIMRVQLDTRVPILSCVLTPLNFHEHAVHQEFFQQHLQIKGEESSRAMLALLAERSRILRGT